MPQERADGIMLRLLHVPAGGGADTTGVTSGRRAARTTQTQAGLRPLACALYPNMALHAQLAAAPGSSVAQPRIQQEINQSTNPISNDYHVDYSGTCRARLEKQTQCGLAAFA